MSVSYEPGPNGEQPGYWVPQPPQKKRRGALPWVLGIVAVLIAGLCLGGLWTMSGSVDKANETPAFRVPSPTTSAPKKTVKDAKPPVLKTSISDGTWQVGHDIAPGQWKTHGAQDGQVPLCYWDVRAKHEDGEIKTQGVKNTPDAQGVVTLRTGDWFNTSGCQEWTKSGGLNVTALSSRKVYVINHLPSSWPVTSAQVFVDKYTGSNWVMAKSCPSSAYRCITVLKDNSLRAPVIAATYCYNCSRVTIRVDVAYANSRGYTSYNRRKNIIAHEFGHAGEIRVHSSRCGNLMYAHANCIGWSLTSGQKAILRKH